MKTIKSDFLKKKKSLTGISICTQDFLALVEEAEAVVLEPYRLELSLVVVGVMMGCV